MKLLGLILALVGTIYLMAVVMSQLSMMVFAPELCRTYLGFFVWCSL